MEAANAIGHYLLVGIGADLAAYSHRNSISEVDWIAPMTTHTETQAMCERLRQQLKMEVLDFHGLDDIYTEKQLADDADLFFVRDDVRWKARALITRQQEDLAKLREALKPFKDAFDGCVDDETDRDEWEIWEHPSAMNIKIADLRRARAALEATK